MKTRKLYPALFRRTAISVLLFLAACNPNVEIRRVQLINQTPYEVAYFGIASSEAALVTAENRLSTPLSANSVADADVETPGSYWLRAVAATDDGPVERTHGPVSLSEGIVGWAWNTEGDQIITGTDSETLYGQTSLPIVVIDTYGEAIPDEPKIAAAIHTIDGGIGAVNRPSLLDNDFSSPMAIERRGNSTETFPKHSWSLELRDAFDEDRDAPLLGLPEEEDWVLYGPWMDRSLIRNVLGYGLWEELGWYAPRTRFCEVYLYDDPSQSLAASYHGLYVLTEKIKRDKLRLDLARLDSQVISEPGLSGGYVLEMKLPDRLEADEFAFPLSDGFVVTIVSPNERKITALQRAWIRDHLAAFERALYGGDFLDPESGYAPFIDDDSFIDYMLLQEFFKNRDAFHSSTFFYKDRGAPLHMGPIWDLNIAMGYFSFNGHQDTGGWILREGGSSIERSHWSPRLLDDPGFRERYRARWFELRASSLSDDSLRARIDAIIAELDTAQARQFIRWPSLGRTLVPAIRYLMFTGPHPDSYAGEIDYLKRWLQERAAWIDANIGSL